MLIHLYVDRFHGVSLVQSGDTVGGEASHFVEYTGYCVIGIEWWELEKDLSPERVVGVVVVHRSAKYSCQTSGFVLLDLHITHLIRDEVRQTDSTQAGAVERHDVRSTRRPRLNEHRVVGGRPVEDMTVGQSSLGKVAPRSANEVVGFTDRRADDPLAGCGDGGPSTDALDDIGVIECITQVDEAAAKCTEVHDVRVGVYESWHDDRVAGFHDPGVRASGLDQVGEPARLEDHAVVHEYRFHDRVRIVEGQDLRRSDECSAHVDLPPCISTSPPRVARQVVALYERPGWGRIIRKDEVRSVLTSDYGRR